MQTVIDDGFNRTAREARRIIFSLLECEKPLIARLNGHATGFGATLALFCDVAIAVDTAKIGDPHVQVGFTAGDGSTVIWPQLIGYARAKEFLMTGDLLTAPEAARIGLINYSVPAEDLDARVYGLATRLAEGPQVAIRTTKMSVNIGLRQLAASMMDACLAYEAISNMSTITRRQSRLSGRSASQISRGRCQANGRSCRSIVMSTDASDPSSVRVTISFFAGGPRRRMDRRAGR